MLSDLYDSIFTIVNQIPQSDFSNKKVLWEMHTLKRCARIGGVYDKTQKNLVLTEGKFTVYIDQADNFRPPHFVKKGDFMTSRDFGYYAIPADKRNGFFTACKGDLIVFDNVMDMTPTNIDEYDALIEKYSGNSMTVSDFEVFYVDGWKTNHIEVY